MRGNRLPGSRSRPLSRTPVARSVAPGAGRPLAEADRSYFENRFGEDFANVRVHTGTEAGAFAGAMGAKAVTSGEDIAFAAGRYRPGTPAGRELIAHELAHVAQQREGGTPGAGGAEVGARDAARTVAQGGSVSAQSLGGAGEGGLYCDDDEKAQVPPPTVAPTAVPPPLLPYRKPWMAPQLQPPLFQMPPAYDPNTRIDWLGMRSPFESRGVPFTMRDANDITSEWYRSKQMLETLGIDEKFKFWFINQDWILNKGIQYQLDTINARDNPNRMDVLQREWSSAMSEAGEWKIPPITLFSKQF